jgi:hypothetical protein
MRKATTHAACKVNTVYTVLDKDKKHLSIYSQRYYLIYQYVI